jgi:hypothetical protein
LSRARLSLTALLILIPAILEAAPAAAQTPAPRPRGVVFVVGGVGGYDTLPISAQVFLPPAGVHHEIRNFVWTHGVGRLFRDLQDTAHVVRKAADLAALIRQEKAREPDRPLYLVAKSGGAGLALLAAEQLPPGTLRRMVLLSAAVSPTYDLRPALRATAGEIVSFCSRNDRLVLEWGTSTFGTIDRHYGPSEGLAGFVVPTSLTPDDQALYARLVQLPWQPRMLLEGYAGTHTGTSAPPFLASEVAPWLRD